LLEVTANSLRREDQHIAHQVRGPRRKTRANRPVVERLVPDLVVEIVEQVFGKLSSGRLATAASSAPLASNCNLR
jgi:hypothetical protein